MRFSTRNSSALLRAACGALLLACQPVDAGDIVLGFQPALIDAVPTGGQAAEVAATVSGLGPTQLSAFNLVISYNPAVLHFESVEFGDPDLGDQLDLLGFGSETSHSGAPAGVLRISEVSLDDSDTLNTLQAASFVLAQLLFTTTGLPGFSPLTNLNSGLAPALLVDAGDPPAFITHFSITAGRVNTTHEPSSLALIVMSMVGWMSSRSRRLRSA